MAPSGIWLRSVVLDTTDCRGLAEFYRQVLGWRYPPEGEPPPRGEPDPFGEEWLVLLPPGDGPRLAFQHVAELPRSTWPGTDVPQQVHLDMGVPDKASLMERHAIAVELGATVLEDGSDDEEQPIFIYADPSGHPFCIFVHDS